MSPTGIHSINFRMTQEYSEGKISEQDFVKNFGDMRRSFHALSAKMASLN